MLETLVVGAGPVGLVAALELARRGRDVRIIEKREDEVTESRALGINPRTLDILEPSGVSERIRAEGIRIHRARLISRGQTLGTIAFSAVRHRFPFMLALPQARTQTILREALESLGVKVEKGREFIANLGTADQPVCLIDGGGGQEEVAVRYLLGCDGPHSVVRDTAGIAFEGHVNDRPWTLADMEADWDYPPDEARFILSAAGNLFMLPVAHGVWRFVTPSESVEALMPGEVKLGSVLWRSRFRIAHKLARTMQNRSVFIAGDAAHVHSPAGARGMNGGIEDAATFAWLAENGRLDQYSSMRRPAARRVLRQVARQTRQAEATGGAFMGLRETLARIVLPWPMVQAFASRFITAQDSADPAWLRH